MNIQVVSRADSIYDTERTSLEGCLAGQPATRPSESDADGFGITWKCTCGTSYNFPSIKRSSASTRVEETCLMSYLSIVLQDIVIRSAQRQNDLLGSGKDIVHVFLW